MNVPEQSPLGKTTTYAEHYDPGLLFPIPRAPGRAALGLDARPPFHGTDLWNAYELSWLDLRGKPQVALAEFRVPAASSHLIESKSLKLYLNGFAQERVAGTETLAETLRHDLSAAAGAPVQVALSAAGARAHAVVDLEGESIDGLELDIDDYGPPRPDYLRADGEVVEQALVSDLLKSNCPVTGQPDWGSVRIAYRGPAIDQAGLLRYLISFRGHSGFHEQCVERIYMDVWRRCAPQRLSVYARYTRRGGLDINPFRSSEPAEPGNPRGARQ